MNAQTLLANVAELVKTKLKPLVDDIDRKGYYPEAFMRELGAIGAVGIEAEGGNGLGLATRIAVLREIGKECGATSFSAWCQAACAWYLHQTPNRVVKEKYLADILQGKVLAGTGMSNTVKHLAGIENTTFKPSAWRAVIQSTVRCRGCPTSAKTTFGRIPPKSAAATSCSSQAGKGKA
ncbi:acyl-CoA dehydrogenase [Neisseria gonorrhoeae]|uniref:Acyl-CoA dehydrogenase n=1 Tax=Neisseria gonorrhoeae TaxID=485 RepID=A0A378VW01_NEIGO|nr:acyl-CoA dehydrogenase [Neisseria gonorrhoeae]